MAASAVDLCLVADVAADLGVTADAALQRAVTAASRAAAVYCGRDFFRSPEIVEYPAGFGTPNLLLERAPILAVESVSVFGLELDASEYTFEGQLGAAGMLLRRRGVWPRTARDTGLITEGASNFQGQSGTLGVTVTYSGGFVTPGQKALDNALTVTLPEDVQEAAILAAVAFYRRRGVDPGIASEALGDWSVSYRGPNELIGVSGGGGGLPDASRALLNPYRALRVY